MTEELFSLQWQSAEESDRNLISLAEMMGIDARPVVLGLPDDGGDLRENRHFPESGSRVIASARTLVELTASAGSSLIDVLLSKASHFFVYGFEPLVSHQALLSKLTGNTLTSVCALESKDARYLVSGAARDLCHQLSGLAFGPTDPENDSTFVGVPGYSNVRELIGIGGKPFFVQTDRSNCNVMLLAGRRIADINSPVPQGVSPLNWFSRIVPAMVFIRHGFGSRCWRNDAPHGCFVVDDPLLKPNYGFLDYEALLGSMKRRNFTTSISFIPWNHSRTSTRNADFFRRNSDKYSLSVHGCDHTKAEFGIIDSKELSRRASLAMDRMILHERRTGLPFDKVMVFPQGIFSSAALKSLKSYNYVAAVNSTPYAIDRPPTELCLRDFLDVAMTRYCDFPIFNRRYPVDISACAMDLFLGKPVLLVEHHGYFKDGYEALERFVEQLQALDPRIIWGNLESACVNSCLRKLDQEGVTHVKIYTDRVSVVNRAPERKCYLVWRQTRDDGPPIEATANGKNVAFRLEHGAVSVSIQLNPGEVAELRLRYKESRQLLENSSPRLIDASRTYLRRHLCELRDDCFAKNAFLSKLMVSGRKLLHKS
jgi:hypothetical protein